MGIARAMGTQTSARKSATTISAGKKRRDGAASRSIALSEAMLVRFALGMKLINKWSVILQGYD
jgi:hypothetical protein